MYPDECAMYRFSRSLYDSEEYPDAWLEGVPPKPRLYCRLPSPNTSGDPAATQPAQIFSKWPFWYSSILGMLAGIGLLIVLLVK